MPGCREIVEHGRNGLLVPPRDPQAIADAIQQLTEDPALRQRMGAAGRALVEKAFSEERTVEQTLALYQRLVAVGDATVST
jgi:glycosyltransferase involved in cell wall biosynthesis